MAVHGDQNACRGKTYSIPQHSVGFISSSLAHDKGWGSMQCPWKLEALPGQNIKVTLIHFSPRKNQRCHPLG